MGNKVLKSAISLLFAVTVALLILSLSIAIPIFCRPIYYAHIDALDIPEQSGFTVEQIHTSYDAVLDYLTKPNKEFSVGDMAYTYMGAEHFREVKNLFTLNTTVLICSAVCVIVILILKRSGKIGDLRLGKHTATFYSGSVILATLVSIGIIAAIDFEGAFLLFHETFFPNNDYWVFDTSTDEIINILPEEFFMNCGIIIAVTAIVLSLAFIIFDIIKNRKKQVDFKGEV
ncbi:MAG: TIGR01906 family membrane protein [Clostridia bacterium]|nr:TIGR01906 family membrane protein [Clostridia bacterium]